VRSDGGLGGGLFVKSFLLLLLFWFYPLPSI
jgi:hypothetical protein